MPVKCVICMKDNVEGRPGRIIGPSGDHKVIIYQCFSCGYEWIKEADNGRNLSSVQSLPKIN